jgi:uncharacterized protein YegP (UPF0339 family)
MPPTEIYTDSSGQWRWRIRAKNGKVIAASGESFDNHSNAVRAATGAAKEFEPKPEQPTSE